MANTSFRLLEDIKSVITETQAYVTRNVNSAMIAAYFQIGRMIVEDQQQGNNRAGYAKETIGKLSVALTKEFGKGYSEDNLERFRNFYLVYQNRISASAMRKSSENHFTLSWTHYVHLLKIKDSDGQIFAKEYKAVLPSKEELKKQLE